MQSAVLQTERREVGRVLPPEDEGGGGAVPSTVRVIYTLWCKEKKKESPLRNIICLFFNLSSIESLKSTVS